MLKLRRFSVRFVMPAARSGRGDGGGRVKDAAVGDTSLFIRSGSR
jgi:hypothetical protein